MTKKTIILLAFIIVKFLLSYHLISPEYDLQRDEYLHLDQAGHLAWGYLSVPPVTSWNSYLIYLLGNSVFWVKFFPALFGALTLLVVWKTIEVLKGNLFALVLGATGVLFSILLRLNILYQPNSLDVLCWTLLYYALIRYIHSDRVTWLYIGAVVFAFGFLNKYNIAFCVLGLVPALLITRQRQLFVQKHLYLAALLALVLILPNLLWQYENHFPVIHHMKELSQRQLVNVDRLGFLRSQLLFFVGALPVILAGLYAILFYAPMRKYAVFFWSLVFTLAVFLYFKAKDYYAIGIYPIYLSFGAVFLADLLDSGWKRYLRPVLLIIPLLFFALMYRVLFPTKSPAYIVAHAERYKRIGLLRWEDGKDHPLPQDFADMLGWKELAHKVDSVYALMPAPAHTLVLCDNYGQAGAINFYTKKGVKAVSFNADYVNWFDLSVRYDHLIRVKDNVQSRELEKSGPFFEKGMLADSVANSFAREYGTVIYVFTGAKIDISGRIKKEIEEMKRKWR